MTTPRDPEAILAAWLDEGPTDLPDATRRAILTALPTTSQARRGLLAPRRFLPMNVFMRSALAVLVAAVAVGSAIYLIGRQPGYGGVASPSPTTGTPGPSSTPRPSPTPLDVTTWTPFTSSRNGASAKFPSDATVTAATVSWIWQTHDPGPPELATDRAVEPDRSAFVIASQRIPAGMSDAAWWADYLSQGPNGNPAQCFPAKQSDYSQVTVSGLVGYEHGGLAGCNFTEVIVLIGGRAYQLTAYVNVDSPTPFVFDPAEFSAWLGTIRLTPASAIDTTASPAPS